MLILAVTHLAVPKTHKYRLDDRFQQQREAVTILSWLKWKQICRGCSSLVSSISWSMLALALTDSLSTGCCKIFVKMQHTKVLHICHKHPVQQQPHQIAAVYYMQLCVVWALSSQTGNIHCGISHLDTVNTSAACQLLEGVSRAWYHHGKLILTAIVIRWNPKNSSDHKKK